jgi:hypothetical protein
MLPIIEAVENIASPTVLNPLPEEVLINAATVQEGKAKVDIHIYLNR